MVKSMHRERERKARLAVASEKGSQPNKGSRKALDPEQLGKLENFLRRADLSNLMRRQAVCALTPGSHAPRSEEHTSDIQSLMRISYAGFGLKKKHIVQTTARAKSTHNENK